MTAETVNFYLRIACWIALAQDWIRKGVNLKKCITKII